MRVPDAEPARERLETGVAHFVHIADCGLYAAKARGRDQIALGEAVADDPGRLTVVDQPKSSSHRPQAARPAFHEAADEEEPHPSGLEIR